jgi:hypothetical protein
MPSEKECVPIAKITGFSEEKIRKFARQEANE